MRSIILSLLLLLTVTMNSQRREVHILAVNDMHSNIEAMPRLAAIADSLRELHPSLLVLSAGDNRTGNPLNDMYVPSGYPMVALMNQIGFNASAIGNHDFDVHSLPELISLSNFRYLCANIHAADSTGIKTRPWQVFDVEGLRVGIIGSVQINKQGHPDTHPDNLVGITFSAPEDAVVCHEWLSKTCDVTILLSHAGYRSDTLTARLCPWLDLIVGGHMHKQLTPDEVRHGVLITQNTLKLRYATHITLTVDSGHVTDKKAEYIELKTVTRQNPVVKRLVDFFSDNSYFHHVLAHAITPFDTNYELGCMVCDAFIDGTGADVSIENFLGVRLPSLPAGDITVRDVLTMDPFCNAAYIFTLSGKELNDMVKRYSRMEVRHFPHLGGLKADVKLDKNDPQKITHIRLMNADGSPLDLKRIYRVATNSYVAAACKSYGITGMERLNRETADIIMRFLEKQDSVDYQGVKRINFR